MFSFEQIKELIALVSEHGLDGIEIERSGFRLKIDGQGSTQGAPVVAVDRRVVIQLDRTELGRVRSFPFAYEDVLYLPPGRYLIDLRLRDQVEGRLGRVGGEFEIPAVPAAATAVGYPAPGR